ncbi:MULTISPECIES: winged helix-turn-helix transcriptional regulator [Salinibaculum]|uniref:winged helix-turn-helix transcriptional regulator n=1 Tax=Salinibaculum TaxID=2732368 RepID=UPI0030D5A574
MSGTETRDDEIRAQNADACPVIHAIDEIGTRWRLNVLHALQSEEKRFNELKRATGARSKTLSDALDALVEADLVERRREVASPVAVYYSLTEKGRALWPVLDELGDWAGEWVEGVRSDPTVRPRSD